jgi:hypothetical protein
MKKKDADEVIQILPKGRTKFYYFKDKYALDLLQMALEEEASVANLKRSPESSVS